MLPFLGFQALPGLEPRFRRTDPSLLSILSLFLLCDLSPFAILFLFPTSRLRIRSGANTVSAIRVASFVPHLFDKNLGLKFLFH